MSRFDFLFLESNDEEMPFMPIAQIFVSLHLKDPEGKILISPHCLTIKEVDEEINSMIQNLEAIRRNLTSKFKKCHANRGRHKQKK